MAKTSSLLKIFVMLALAAAGAVLLLPPRQPPRRKLHPPSGGTRIAKPARAIMKNTRFGLAAQNR